MLLRAGRMRGTRSRQNLVMRILFVTQATLSFRVRFKEGFDFVKGGKLHGLYGGKKGCSGGKTGRLLAPFPTEALRSPPHAPISF